MITIAIHTSATTKSKIQWVLELLKHNHSAELQIVSSEVADHTIGSEATADIRVSDFFYQDLEQGIYSHEHHMPSGPVIRLEDGSPDYISTIFYLVNSLQEYGCKDLDQYGRFKYANSLQKKWGIVTENKVWDYIQLFCDKHKVPYSKAPINSCYLTHDIDFIYAGWKMEGKWALKRGKLLTVAKILLRRLKGQAVYANIKEIVDRERKHGLVSTFFWITQQGKCSAGIKNSDYDIKDRLVSEQMKYATAHGASHGLHKSSLPRTFREEMVPLGSPTANRYHFLKFSLPSAYDAIEEAGIQIDTSLGFAEHYGYRNSYGLPFRPYNLKENRSYRFIEVPLHVMDGTMVYYMKMQQGKVYDVVANWMQEVSSHTLITLLWHNNELANYSYAEMSNCYDRLLKCIADQQMKSSSEEALIETYLDVS